MRFSDRPDLTERFEDVLEREPIFAVTADVDWASEACNAHLMATFGAHNITPTVFVTHPSAVLSQCHEAGAVELAIHPNFLPGSSHGDTPEQVVSHVRTIVPWARGSRSHAYAMSSHIVRALRPHMQYDSGPMLYLNERLRPLHHSPGFIHYPVFWEDDVHWEWSDNWCFEAFRPSFKTPGLKIIDVHPFFFALNIPDQSFYLKYKPLIQSLSRQDMIGKRFRGPGCAAFTMDLLSWIAGSGYRCLPLGMLHDWHLGQGASAKRPLRRLQVGAA